MLIMFLQRVLFSFQHTFYCKTVEYFRKMQAQSMVFQHVEKQATYRYVLLEKCNLIDLG